MTDDKGYPSYQGYLNDSCVTIAECLQNAGYFTAISGKWHVGSEVDQLPLSRGFEQFYGIPEGGGHHYQIPSGRRLMLDDTAIDAPDDWYTTTAFTDYSVQFLDEGIASNRPVFLYLAYTAPHWPLQAPHRTDGF